ARGGGGAAALRRSAGGASCVARRGLPRSSPRSNRAGRLQRRLDAARALSPVDAGAGGVPVPGEAASRLQRGGLRDRGSLPRSRRRSAMTMRRLVSTSLVLLLGAARAASPNGCNLGCAPCSRACSGGCLGANSVAHASLAPCNGGGAFDLRGTVYETT